ncbi:PrsW family glutamic-type intramembrane protease [uncultured Tyzzerella sp.]|uniref:PrsW family glutamic-type intramembrane protease n=1 Tax=uncultured Tyzzerella sp. TaxID=2321398 RepID=UPI002942FD22|nr:PrsW family glutamic-type intramembrane protease [uncultured Tyzzerella sp.]
MGRLLYICIAPIVIILLTVYIKDKYEKEPIKLALTGTFYGIVIAVPITFTEKYITSFAPPQHSIYYPFFISFIVASFVEETYKYIILMFLIYKNNNYNEPFDGILYAVYISLGFAIIENILYIFNPMIGGLYTAIARAIFSVPAHAIFGVYMGYYLSKEKFFKHKMKIFSLIIAIFIHGVYDLLLFPDIKYSNIFFVIFFVYIFFISLKRINYYIKISPFKD